MQPIPLNPPLWGKPVKGIRMALSYLPTEGVIEIGIENLTTQVLLLPLGYLGGEDRLKLIAATGQKTEIAIFTNASGVAPGRAYPFVVPLLPGSRYVVRRPTYQYWISSINESLGKFMLRHPSLHAELFADTAHLNLDCFSVRNIWTGTLISNSVQLR